MSLKFLKNYLQKINVLNIDGADDQNVSFHTICMFAFSISEIDAENAEVVKFSELEMYIMSTAL